MKFMTLVGDVERFARGASLLLLFIPAAGAAAERTVWQSGFDYVALETVPGLDQVNDHPVRITLERMVGFLQEIELEKDDEKSGDSGVFDFLKKKEERGQVDYLFNEQELRKLSKPLADALTNARPEEDVIFRVSSPREIRFGKRVLSTTGRVFFDGKLLNLIVGEIRVTLEQRYRIRGGPSDVAEKVDVHKLRAFRLDQASRSKQVADQFLARGNSSSFMTMNDGEVRKDWLLIDLAGTPISRGKTPKAAGVTSTETTIQAGETAEDREERETPPISKKEEEQRYRSERAQQDPEASSMEARLRKLKYLFERGAIPEDLYKRKVMQILDEL